MTKTIGLIGDVHGELGKLRSLVKAVSPIVDELVFLGDYINRGPNSFAVLEYLIALGAADAPCTFLWGNHEQSMLHALLESGFTEFLQMGGASTVRSYIGTGTVHEDVESQFRVAVPRSHVNFLHNLRESFRIEGNLFAAHSPGGADSPSRSDFCVYGHVPQTMLVPTITEKTALIDTGCGLWPKGRLTCFIWPDLYWLQDS